MVIEEAYNIVGWSGLVLLVVSYIFLLTKWSRIFVPLDTFASYLLTIHAIIIGDIPFIIVNGWIAVMLSIKWYKRELVVK